MKTFFILSIVAYILLGIVLCAATITYSFNANPVAFYFGLMASLSFLIGKIVERMWINFEIGGVI